MLKSVEMNAMHLIIFIKKHIVNFITDLEIDQTPTGFLNFIGNKGSIGISFKLLGVSFLFMNCHFAGFFSLIIFFFIFLAGDNEITSRNDTYDYIEENAFIGIGNLSSFKSSKFFNKILITKSFLL